jgi:acyl-CoA reductase-like NAD-dependent aldehyde dehydrogenase
VCANRILVQDGVYDAFTERLAETAGAMKVADGFEPGAVIGPLIDMKAVEKVEAHIADAVKKGAKIVIGDKRAAQSGSFFGLDRCHDRYGHHQGGDLRPRRPALPLVRNRYLIN